MNNIIQNFVPLFFRNIIAYSKKKMTSKKSSNMPTIKF